MKFHSLAKKSVTGGQTVRHFICSSAIFCPCLHRRLDGVLSVNDDLDCTIATICDDGYGRAGAGRYPIAAIAIIILEVDEY